MSLSDRRLLIENVHQAELTIDPVFLNTPQFISESLSALLDLTFINKIESVNPIRSFKGRGTEVLLSRVDNSHLICASAGNFGQAMAYSCRKRNVEVTVYAGQNANTLKVERMRALGAQVVLTGADFDAAKVEAKRVAVTSRTRFVEDSQDIETLEGSGTIALELLRFPHQIDYLLVALGNGALINGMATVYKTYHPKTKIIAVQAHGAPAMVESWRSGNLVAYDHVQTIADGIAVRIPVPQALVDMNGLVDDALLVQEETIVLAMQLLHQHVGLVTEPSGAVGLAAILENKKMFAGKTVATVICGGNLTAEQIDQWITTPA
jgi:threonine dehydratase